MPLMTVLVGVWAGLTTILVVLLIYRSTLSMHEDDQLFLDEAESHMEQEQTEIRRRVGRLSPFVRVLSAASGMLILVIAGLWVYQGLTQVQ